MIEGTGLSVELSGLSAEDIMGDLTEFGIKLREICKKGGVYLELFFVPLSKLASSRSMKSSLSIPKFISSSIFMSIPLPLTSSDIQSSQFTFLDLKICCVLGLNIL